MTKANSTQNNYLLMFRHGVWRFAALSVPHIDDFIGFLTRELSRNPDGVVADPTAAIAEGDVFVFPFTASSERDLMAVAPLSAVALCSAMKLPTSSLVGHDYERIDPLRKLSGGSPCTVTLHPKPSEARDTISVHYTVRDVERQRAQARGICTIKVR